MMKHLRLLYIIIFTLALCACHHDDPVRPKARRTVIVYMAAENSLASFLDGDVSEMLKGKDSIPLDCNLVLYIDDTTMPTCYTISSQTGKAIWKTYPEQNSCDSLTFRNTLAEIIHEFPADHYGLVMWSHGSGWVPMIPSKAVSKSAPRRTIGVDNMMNNSTNNGSELDIRAMRRMLEQLGIHWDYIFFDACFMQCVEVDYELRNVCDYIIASPAEIPGVGAPYHLIMSSLFKDENAAQDIATIYHQYNVDTSPVWSGKGLIVSVADCSKMDSLALTMKQFIPTLFANKRQYDTYGIQLYCKNYTYSAAKIEYFDLGSAMNQFLASPSDYEVLTSQLHRTYPIQLQTPYWLSEFFSSFQGTITDSEHIASVSMFIPNDKYDTQNYNQAFRDFEWYHAAGWDETGW